MGDAAKVEAMSASANLAWEREQLDEHEGAFDRDAG
jgi:hypothetical protein